MSTLAMILTAAMVVPASGPEKESGEVQQGLDMSGEWKGSLRGSDGGFAWVRLTEGIMEITEDSGEGFGPSVSFTDEGEGNFSVRIGDHVHLGVYHQEGDRFVACYGEGSHRPASFQPTHKTELLLILHRVKPRK
jgi:hypothetical protein